MYDHIIINDHEPFYRVYEIVTSRLGQEHCSAASSSPLAAAPAARSRKEVNRRSRPIGVCLILGHEELSYKVS